MTEFLATNSIRYDAGLDFGCGLGVLLPTLSELTTCVYATDLELRPATQIVSTMNISNVAFVPPQEAALRLRPAMLDYVVSTDVLEHVNDLPMIVRQFAVWLRSGGRLVISGPTENFLYKMCRVFAGFGGKGDYHHTDIHRIHTEIEATGDFRTTGRRILPIPGIVEGFYIYSYARL